MERDYNGDEEHPMVVPTPEPSREPFDPHMMPLDDEGDYIFLDRSDPRRKVIESRRGVSD
jgi:hypothetical protein